MYWNIVNIWWQIKCTQQLVPSSILHKIIHINLHLNIEWILIRVENWHRVHFSMLIVEMGGTFSTLKIETKSHIKVIKNYYLWWLAPVEKWPSWKLNPMQLQNFELELSLPVESPPEISNTFLWGIPHIWSIRYNHFITEIQITVSSTKFKILKNVQEGTAPTVCTYPCAWSCT